jgi:hypothetical protein
MCRRCVLHKARIKRRYSRGRKIILTLIVFALFTAAQFYSMAQDPLTTPITVVPNDITQAPEQMRKTIKLLRAEIESLRTKVTKLERTLQAVSIRDLITKEEQRAEGLQSQLLLVAEKEANLQSQMSAIAEQLRSDNIDQFQVMGSTRPEQVREATDRRLRAEKQRIQSQLDLLQQTRVRLQASLAVADLLIQRLRAQIQSSLTP